MKVNIAKPLQSVRRNRLARVSVALATVASFLAGCSRSKVPTKGSTEYAIAVLTFYVGLAAIKFGNDVRADQELASIVKLAPGEAAGWANWGVLASQQRNY